MKWGKVKNSKVKFAIAEYSNKVSNIKNSITILVYEEDEGSRAGQFAVYIGPTTKGIGKYKWFSSKTSAMKYARRLMK